MTSNAFFTIPIPAPGEVSTQLASTSASHHLHPRDEVERAVLAEILARNEARSEALLPLVDVALELRHFRENRSLIEYQRWLRANIEIYERLEAKHYRRWVAKNPTKRDFVEPAALAAHRTMERLLKRQRRKTVAAQ